MQCALTTKHLCRAGRDKANTMLQDVDNEMGMTQRHERWTVPPQVVLSTQLHISTDNGNLHSDEHRQRAHHKTEPKDVVEVSLRDIDKVLTCAHLLLDGVHVDVSARGGLAAFPLVQHACRARCSHFDVQHLHGTSWAADVDMVALPLTGECACRPSPAGRGGRSPARWRSWRSRAPQIWCQRAAGRPPGTARPGGRPSGAEGCGGVSGWCALGTP